MYKFFSPEFQKRASKSYKKLEEITNCYQILVATVDNTMEMKSNSLGNRFQPPMEISEPTTHTTVPSTTKDKDAQDRKSSITDEVSTFKRGQLVQVQHRSWPGTLYIWRCAL